MKETDLIASRVLAIFRQQRGQANRNKEKFGDWHHRLAEALLEPLAELYLIGAKKGRAKRDDMDSVAAAAKARSILAAKMINDTSGEWVRDGREPNIVFSVERAMMIAETETVNALNEGKAIPVQARGGQLRWKVGGAPCPQCRRLNNKVVKAGKPFIVINDNPVYAPPLHPHCNCRVEEVK